MGDLVLPYDPKVTAQCYPQGCPMHSVSVGHVIVHILRRRKRGSEGFSVFLKVIL